MIVRQVAHTGGWKKACAASCIEPFGGVACTIAPHPCCLPLYVSKVKKNRSCQMCSLSLLSRAKFCSFFCYTWPDRHQTSDHKRRWLQNGKAPLVLASGSPGSDSTGPSPLVPTASASGSSSMSPSQLEGSDSPSPSPRSAPASATESPSLSPSGQAHTHGKAILWFQFPFRSTFLPLKTIG